MSNPGHPDGPHEIAEQPDAVRRTLAALLPQRDALRGIAEGRRRVLFVARGSSDNAAVYGRYLLETHAGVVDGLASPSVATHCGPDSTSVTRSSSASLSRARPRRSSRPRSGPALAGPRRWASPTSRLAPGGSPRRARWSPRPVPSSRCLPPRPTCASWSRWRRSAPRWRPSPPRARRRAPAVPDEVERLLTERTGIDEAVAALEDAAYSVVSGRGLMMGTALETALKLEETCLRPVRGYSYADLRHGPISVVTSGMTAVLVAASDGPMVGPMRELADDLSGRGAKVVGIGGDPAFAAACAVRPRPRPDRGSRPVGGDRPVPARRGGAGARSAWTPTTAGAGQGHLDGPRDGFSRSRPNHRHAPPTRNPHPQSLKEHP